MQETKITLSYPEIRLVPGRVNEYVITDEVKDSKFKYWLGAKVIKVLERFRILEKKKDKVTDIKSVTINMDYLEEALLKCCFCVEKVYEDELDTIIIGTKQLHLCNKVPLQFEVPRNHTFRTGASGLKLPISGMKVVVVPWFDGVLPVLSDYFK